MLVRMVCKNIDRKNMLLYALGMILATALETFFLTALMAKEQYGLGEKAGSMDWLCTVFFLAAGAVSVFFTLYSTGYYIRTKNKDYSLLMMLGGSRRMVFCFFTAEFLLVYGLSAVAGILAGGVLSALFLSVLGSAGYAVALPWSAVARLVMTVIKMGGCLFAAQYLAILIYFSRRNLSAMQLRGVRRDGQHRIGCILVFGGIGLTVYAMILLLQHKDTLHELISMALCLVGMYLLLSYGGSIILMLLRLFHDFYYRNIIVLNAFYVQFKSNCRLLYMMFVLDFVVLFFTGGCVVSQIQPDVDSAEYPYGFVGVCENRDGGIRAKAYRRLLGDGQIEVHAVEGVFVLQGYPQSCLCISDRDFRQLTAHDTGLEATEAILVNESTVNESGQTGFLYIGKDSFELDETGNFDWRESASAGQVLGEEASVVRSELDSREIAMRLVSEGPGARQAQTGVASTGGQEQQQGSMLRITKVQDEVVFGLEKPDSLRQFAVLPESVITGCEGEGYTILAKKGDVQDAYQQYKTHFQESDTDVFWRCAYLAEANENMLFVKIVSVFAGLFCLLAGFALFALKIQGDVPSLRLKYGLLYQLGMSEKAIAKAMSAEYRIMLAIPVFLSILVSGIYMLAELDGEIRKYVCGYIPFQAGFLVLNGVLMRGVLQGIGRNGA